MLTFVRFPRCLIAILSQYVILQVEGQGRQNVRLAAQLLSEHCGKALKRYFPEYSSQSSFILNLDKAFDVLNSRQLKDIKEERCGFGLKPDAQNTALTFLTKVFPLCRFLHVKRLLPCQKAFIIAGYAINQLSEYVRDRYQVNFLLTAKLNQDCLENFFSRVRRIGASSHPNCTDFESRMKILLLGVDIPTSLTQNASVQDMEVDDADDTPISTACSMGFESSECVTVDSECDDTHQILAELSTNQNVPSEASIASQQEAMTYVAGYLAYRLKKTHPHYVGKPVENSWISEISKGNLIYPSQELLDLIHEFELVFCLFHGKKLDKNPGVIQRFLELLKSKYPSCDDQFLKLYCRTRTFLRLKHLKKCFVEKQINYRNIRKKKQWAASKVF